MADTLIQPGTGTETATNLSLADLDNEGNEGSTGSSQSSTSSSTTTATTTTNEGGEATKTPEELAAEEAAAKAAAEAEANKGEGEGEEDGEGMTPEQFYNQVNALHGFEDFKVEYPEGVDPLSPEGLHIREKALIAKATNDFDGYLKQSDPRAYAYMLHRQNGGSDEEFLSTPSITLPDYEQFKTNVDLQKQILERDLLNRGVDKDIIDATIEKAIKDEKLFEKANKAYQGVKASEEKALADAETAAKARVEAETRAINETIGAITDIVMNSKVDAIVIPDAKRAEFADYIKQHLYFDGQQFFITKPVAKDTLASTIQAEYFGFVKGDLKGLVERKAATKVAQTIRLGATKTKTTTKTGDSGIANKDYTPLGDL